MAYDRLGLRSIINGRTRMYIYIYDMIYIYIYTRVRHVPIQGQSLKESASHSKVAQSIRSASLDIQVEADYARSDFLHVLRLTLLTSRPARARAYARTHARMHARTHAHAHARTHARTTQSHHTAKLAKHTTYRKRQQTNQTHKPHR